MQSLSDGLSGYVALKVNTAARTGKNNELVILRWLRDSSHKQQHHGYRNIIHLLDDFTINSPNGTHDCLVMELVAGIREFKLTSRYKADVKKLSFQLMMGLSYLHEQGVTHGGM